jgi:hypothetical protein
MGGMMMLQGVYFILEVAPRDMWRCYLFGGDESYAPIVLHMQDSKRPNAWVRFWMKVFFGTRWEKV